MFWLNICMKLAKNSVFPELRAVLGRKGAKNGRGAVAQKLINSFKMWAKNTQQAGLWCQVNLA